MDDGEGQRRDKGETINKRMAHLHLTRSVHTPGSEKILTMLVLEISKQH